MGWISGSFRLTPRYLYEPTIFKYHGIEIEVMLRRC